MRTWASVWGLVWDSVRGSVGGSVWNLVWAYSGSAFTPVVKKWAYVKHLKKGVYPFQSGVELWKLGLVPSFDGKLWRLHSGKKAEVIWDGEL